MKIIITGITGTWGQAFTRLLKDEHTLYGIDHNEKAVSEFRHEYPNIQTYLGDFIDYDFEKNPCDLLIHLAAYKHIGICEKNVFACVENNITKTAVLFKNAFRNKVKILFISTDKAVEPINVYGLSKALGERLAREFGGVVARSGNVFASNGSVVQVWEKAIDEKKPIKVTNLEMTRYFIEADDVVKQVWEGYKKGYKLIIPDMGNPISLKELLIKIAKNKGIDLDTYPVEIIGIRPTEKLSEKLWWDNEEPNK